MSNCIICKKELRNLDEPDGNQPSGGTEFFTRGHYGSAVSDFMDGTGLAVNICDPCLLAAKQEKLVLIIHPAEPQPRPRETYGVWR
jgi:hypothetical protein